MGIDEQEREQAILDATAQLLLRHGYNKTTMSDVAEAVDLNRALIYLHFKSKDEVVEALIIRELEKYGASGASFSKLTHRVGAWPVSTAVWCRSSSTYR